MWREHVYVYMHVCTWREGGTHVCVCAAGGGRGGGGELYINITIYIYNYKSQPVEDLEAEGKRIKQRADSLRKGNPPEI